MSHRSEDRFSVPDQLGVAAEPNSHYSSNAASTRDESPELIHFAKLAHDAVCKLETEKSKRQLALRINQIREEERRQTNLKLHAFLDRALALTAASPEAAVPALAHACLEQFYALVKIANLPFPEDE